MTEEQFKEDVLKSCELAVKQQLLVDAVAEAENFQIEDADRENLAEQYGMDVQSMIDNYGDCLLYTSRSFSRCFFFLRAACDQHQCCKAA